MNALHQAVARAIANAIQPALNEWSETGGNPWYARVSGAQEPGDQARLLGDYAAWAAIRVVQDTIDPHSRNWRDGWLTRDAENAVVQREERARVLAEAKRSIETIEGPEWAEDDYWHGWIAQKREALAVLAALGDE